MAEDPRGVGEGAGVGAAVVEPQERTGRLGREPLGARCDEEAGAQMPSGAGQEKLPAMFPPRLAQPPRATSARSVGALPTRFTIGATIMSVPP